MPLFLELGVLLGKMTLHSYHPWSLSLIFVRLMLPWPYPTASSNLWIRPAYSGAAEVALAYQENIVRPWNIRRTNYDELRSSTSFFKLKIRASAILFRSSCELVESTKTNCRNKYISSTLLNYTHYDWTLQNLHFVSTKKIKDK